MKRSSIIGWTVAFALGLASVCASASAFASSYFVSSVTTPETNAQLSPSLRALLNASVTNAGGHVAELEKDADYVLTASVIQLGQAFVLTVTKYKNHEPVYSSRQKANVVEELDDAADRAVRAAMLAKPTKEDLRVGEVRPHEENELRRRILSRDANYFGFGPGGFVAMGVSELAYDVSLGHIWEVTPNAAIKILATTVISGDMKTYFLLGQLGLHYYFTDQDSSPYIGGGLGFGGAASASTAATTIGGFGGSIGVGYQFFRTSSTQFDLFFGYQTLFGNNTIGTPGVYSGRIGILF